MKFFKQSAHSNTFKGIPRFIWLAILAAIVWAAIKPVKAWLKKRKAKREGKADNDNHDSSRVQGPNGVVNLSQSALEIYDSFYNYYGGTAEDEEAAMLALSKVPKSAIADLNLQYAMINGKGRSIYEDFRKYLSQKQYSAIQHLLI